MKVINLYQLGTLDNLTVISPSSTTIELLSNSTIRLSGIDLGSPETQSPERKIVSNFVDQYTAEGRFTSIQSAVIEKIKGSTLRWSQLVPASGSHTIDIPEGKRYVSFINGVKSFNISEGDSVEVVGGRDCIFITDDIFPTNPPTNLEEFTRLFPLDYYDYSETRLLNNMVESIIYQSRTIIAPNDGDAYSISATPSTDEIELPDEEYPDFSSDTIDLDIPNMTEDDVKIFPDGMKDVYGTCDYGVVDTDGVLKVVYKVVGSRSYQEGDEDDATVITDGTTTYYILSSPEEHTLDTPVDMNYTPSANGIEGITPINTSEPETTPFKGNIIYTLG